MSDVVLSEWPEARKLLVELRDNVPVLIKKVDAVMADASFSDSLKEQKIGGLMNTYLQG